MTIDLAALQQLAAQATPNLRLTPNPWTGPNAEYADACSPDVVTALVRAVKAALDMDDIIENSWSDNVFGLRDDEWTDALEPFRQQAGKQP